MAAAPAAASCFFGSNAPTPFAQIAAPSARQTRLRFRVISSPARGSRRADFSRRTSVDAASKRRNARYHRRARYARPISARCSFERKPWRKAPCRSLRGAPPLPPCNRQTRRPRIAGCRQARPSDFRRAQQRGALLGSPRRLPLFRVFRAETPRDMRFVPEVASPA